MRRVLRAWSPYAFRKMHGWYGGMSLRCKVLHHAELVPAPDFLSLRIAYARAIETETPILCAGGGSGGLWLLIYVCSGRAGDQACPTAKS